MFARSVYNEDVRKADDRAEIGQLEDTDTCGGR